jgi:hypothetical protein
MKPTSIDEIKKLKEAQTVELPGFDVDKPFYAKLKRLSLLELCKADAIPNPLLAAVQEIYEGRQRADIKKYAGVIELIAELALVEPKYEDVKDILTDAQKVAIMTYAQHGVAGLLPFFEIIELQKGSNRSKK